MHMSRGSVALLVLLSVLTILVPAQAQQFSISTDRTVYDYGDMATIYIQPAPAIGVDYWLIITKPDGSQVQLDVSPGTVDVTTSAGPPPGQYQVELWGQVPGANPTPQVYAQCTYEVREPAPPQFTISTDRSVYDYGDTVTIYIQPAPAIGVDYSLIITRPDGSQQKRDLSAGQSTVALVAGAPAGQYGVQLWGQVPGQGQSQVYAQCSYEVRQPSPPPPQFTISTDQSVYDYGDTVRIFIQPAPAIGVDYWLIITKPDGSQQKITLTTGQGTATLAAGAPAGRYQVELWGQVPGANPTPQVYAQCAYEVRRPSPPPPQFTISTDQSVYDYGDTVRIFIQPAPAIGVSYWLMIAQPDGAQQNIPLTVGQGTATLVAGAPAGRYEVELLGQVPGQSQAQVFAQCSYEVRQPSPPPPQFTISTDRSVYDYGDTVTIYIQPAPAIGVDYSLIITRPDGSQQKITLTAGQGSATLVASAPAGRYEVQLWGQVPGQGQSQVYAQCSYEARSRVTTITRSTVTTTVVTTTTTSTGRCLLRDGSGNCILRCVIATAAYGSELAPEVVYMRHVRDNLISSTTTGKTLVAAFNMFYYSWSPPVANAIAGSEFLRAVFRIILLPLVAIVHATALVFTVTTSITGIREVASVIAFLAAATMTIAVYVVLPGVAGTTLAQAIRRHHNRIASPDRRSG